METIAFIWLGNLTIITSGAIAALSWHLPDIFQPFHISGI
jgi:hypothetical protein